MIIVRQHGRRKHEAGERHHRCSAPAARLNVTPCRPLAPEIRRRAFAVAAGHVIHTRDHAIRAVPPDFTNKVVHGKTETRSLQQVNLGSRPSQYPRDHQRTGRAVGVRLLVRRSGGQARRHGRSRVRYALQRQQAARVRPAGRDRSRAGQVVVPRDPIVGASTGQREERVRQGRQRRRRPSATTRRSVPSIACGSIPRTTADDQSGRPGWRQPELAEGRPPRADAARGLHPPREDHALRSRADSRAHRPRPRLGRARLLRVSRRRSSELHARVAVRRGGQADAGVRALLDGARRARLDRHRARRPRLRGEVLHRRRATGIWSATTSRSSSSRTR